MLNSTPFIFHLSGSRDGVPEHIEKFILRAIF